MATVIRPQVSARNPYNLHRNRHYELKHFCLQYPLWKEAYHRLDGYSDRSSGMSEAPGGSGSGDPTHRYVEARESLLNKMRMVELAAQDTDSYMAPYILKAVTEGLSFEKLRARTQLPCGKDYYYKMYRRFFWLLSKARN